VFSGALFVFALTQTFALAQAPAPANCVGYVNSTFQPGANLFGNPLDAGTGMNNLNTLFVTAPEGTTVSLWNAGAQQFLPPSRFIGGAWTVNLTLAPGTGALLTTPSSFINPFAGELPCEFTPPVFGGPDGIYLFSSMVPMVLPSTPFDAFTLVIGRAPNAGESVTRLDAAAQTYSTTTFDGFGWNNGVPGLGLGEAAFYNLGPVPVIPEPSVLALAAAMVFGLCGWRERRRFGGG